MMQASRYLLLLSGLALAGPSAAQSLEALRAAPLEITSDEAEIMRSGTMRYSGNVHFTSATLEARGDTLRLHRDADGKVRIAITGEPAELEHRPEGDGAQAMDASARRINFDRNTGIIELQENVKVRRASDRISGETLRYELVEQRITARGGEAGGRVRITIDPETLEGIEQ